MENISSISTFVLGGFSEIDGFQHIYFVCCLVCYLFIILANTVLCSVIIMEDKLHEPMYIFICNLSVNGLYGSTAFFPKHLIDTLSETKAISYAGCFLQIFLTYTFGYNEITFLALMAYDRQVSICNPLRYHSIMTNVKMWKIILCAWLYSSCFVMILLLPTLRLPLCGFIIKSICCENNSLLRLSCVNTDFDRIAEVCITVCNITLLSLIIMYSYVNIFKVCQKSSYGTKMKALHTCITHWLSLIIYLFCGFFQFLTRVGIIAYLPFLQTFTSIAFFVFPPLLNPLIYGIRTQEIRNRAKKKLYGFIETFNSTTVKTI
ncbi:olfactory receptor 2K2-like [Protopterus annectens]|uniref:olfactory receptor 2K2-like n=1 Tax=Protopterus annectens TaxID=7888 RepID=UPI001CF98D34|nr:olfactory receptor 2K2-like [Protopterus annectens]